jgi:hypothetical protein
MAPPSAEVQPQRIAIEREEDWLRVQNNVKEKLKALVDKRMASEDDTDGKLRKEVEARIAEVSRGLGRTGKTNANQHRSTLNDPEIRANLPTSSTQSAREWTQLRGVPRKYVVDS